MHDQISKKKSNSVTFKRTNTKLFVNCHRDDFQKKYLKFLTKKYLRTNKLVDWIHVVANKRNSYQLKYIDIRL